MPVSNGRGATTCSYFLPGDQEVIFASTEGGSPACPPRPDHSQGYVWALYPDYDIYRARADGSRARRLTTTPGYDAEGTVCAKDGSIVFTSVRDGDIDLYRMDKDGNNVRRLTHDLGYDGGAFFNSDCTKIVWRASRPKPGRELDDYQRLLAQNLVRPTKLELYVANADGSDATQVTYLDAASFGPAWEPGDKRLVFASNYGDPRGREFDIWAIDVQGTRLERITTAPGFDGFPLFSPDGKRLAFSSNRATPAGQHDTNVFLAEWLDGPVTPAEELAADRVATDVRWLADPAREGRGVGTPGLAASGAYIEERFRALGLQPGGDGRRLPPGLRGAHGRRDRARDSPDARGRGRRARGLRARRFLGERKGRRRARARGLRPARHGGGRRRLRAPRRARKDRRRASLRARRRAVRHARARATRRRSAPEGLDRARAWRTRPARR